LAFDAFISYSHAADGRLAPALQRAIQRLAKPWYRTRALHVFRDESALSANPHLWSSIEQALDDAEWFVLLASPDAVASGWVSRELDYWLTHKSPDRILVAVTGGTWDWDLDAHALTGTAVPEVLRDAFTDEPRHVDLRWAASELDLDMHHTRFRDVVAQLAAPMHGIAKDDLDSEDVRQHRRAQRLARGGASALTLLVIVSIVFGTSALIERNRANHAAAIATHDANLAAETADAVVSRGLTSSAAQFVKDQDIQSALLASAQSYRFAVASGAAGTTEQTEAASSMLTSLEGQPSDAGFLYGQGGSTRALAWSSDGALVASASDAGTRVWDARTRQPLSRQPSALYSFGVRSLSINRQHLLAAVTSLGPQLWDLRTNTAWHWQPPPTPVAGAILSDTGVLATAATYGDGESRLELWDVNLGRHVAGPIALSGLPLGVAFSPDGNTVAVGVFLINGQELGVQLFNSTTGLLIRTLTGPSVNFASASFDPMVALGFSADGAHLTAVASGLGGGYSACPFCPRTPTATHGSEITWETSSGRRLSMIAPLHGFVIVGASRRGGELVEASTANGPARVIDARSGKSLVGGLTPLDAGAGPEPQTSANTFGLQTADAFNPTGDTLAIATHNNTIGLVSATAPGDTTMIGRKALSRFDESVPWTVLSPDGHLAARLLGTPPSPPSVGPGSYSFAFRSAPQTTARLDAQVSTAKVQLIDTVTDKLMPHQPPFAALGYAFGTDNSLAISTADGIVIWDVRRSRILRHITDPASRCDAADAVAYSGDTTTGRVALACSPDGNSQVATWQMGTKTTQLWQVFTDIAAHTLTWSADGSTLAVQASGTHQALDGRSGRTRLSAPPSIDNANTGVLAASGTTLAVGHPSGSIDLIDGRSGARERTLDSPNSLNANSTRTIAFNPTGTIVVAQIKDADGSLDVWNSTTGVFIAQLNPGQSGHGAGAAPQFTPDGQALNLLTSSANGAATLSTWSFRPDEWFADACRIADRNLTHQEWTTLVGSQEPYQRTCPQWPPGP
jgi:WD40 repeat protein